MVTIEAKALGQRRPLVPDWSIPLPPELADPAAPPTLRALITRVVLSEVEAFRERQAHRRLLHVLTAQQIADAAARGKVDMGGHDLQQEVDAEAAVATALQAFEDGLYYVLIDGEQQERLDAPVALGRESRVTFLRLVALAGG